MKYRLKLLIVASAVFCLSLAGAAQANVVKKCYIDGNDVAQQTAAYALSYDFDRLTIASNGSYTFRYGGLRGAIDEFAIYNGILDDANIVEHANCPPANYVATVMADDPCLYLRFEDPCSANGYTAADSSGNDQNGVYIGDDAVGDVNLVAGFVGNAAEFYGDAPDGNGTCIDVNDANGALELQDLTIEFWFNSTTVYDEGAYPVFFTRNGGVNKNGYAAGISFQIPQNPPDPNDPVFALTGGGTTEYDPVGTKIDDGEWHHIVFTYDSTPDENEPNVGLYPSEVLKDNPVLYIRCEENDPCDYSGNNYWVEADPLVIIKKAPGSMGNCAHLNGGWIAAASQQTEPSPNDPCYAFGPEYAFGDGNDITVEMWFYYPPDTTVATWASLWNQNDKTDISMWSPGCQTEGLGGGRAIRMRCNERRDPQGDGLAYGADAWSTDQTKWHHHVMIYDCCDDPCTIHVELWTDNDQKKSSTYPPTTFDNHIGPWRDHILFGNIGTRQEPGNGAYTPYVDEIAVYDYALPANRIAAHFKAWQPKDCNEALDREMQPEWAKKIDRNLDCEVDFYDFVSFALSWDTCNDPCDANCVPPQW